MLDELKVCTNPSHSFCVYRALIFWQIANTIWCVTQKNDHRRTIFFGVNKIESNDYDSAIYTIIIWKLKIDFGFF